MVRVWFNHWFSTSYWLIELMKQSLEEEVSIIGSNRRKAAVMQLVCDEWYEEPDINGEEYIRYCLDFCEKHRVDVFVPRRHMVEISKNIELFQRKNVKVMVDDYETIQILNDKVKTYEMLKDFEKINIPEYYLVSDVHAFKEAYGNLKKTNDRICMKFAQDEGGLSFRKIVENTDGFAGLRRYPGAEIAYNDLIEILESQDRFDDMILMPYLPGGEISVDCLNTADGLIAVPRIKGSARHEYVEYDENILEMVRMIMGRIGLQYPCNIQFKRKDKIPYLLEINTRMSGGLQLSCLASGVNIPGIALNKILGKHVKWDIKKENRTVSYIETPKIIN